jgi:Tfp pilus assembly protein PilN
VRRTLHGYGAALALLLVAGLAASGVVRWRLAVEAPRLEGLRIASVQAEAMRAQLTAAQQRKEALLEDVRALAALRSAGGVAALSATLDTALNDKVWFEQLQFSRTQELLRPPVPSPMPAGVVQARVAPAPGQAPAPQAWRLAGHVEIAGAALDHGAMSAFLAALAASPVLDNVRFLNSSAAAGDDGGTVAFSAAAALRPAGGAP